MTKGVRRMASTGKGGKGRQAVRELARTWHGHPAHAQGSGKSEWPPSPVRGRHSHGLEARATTGEDSRTASGKNVCPTGVVGGAHPTSCPGVVYGRVGQAIVIAG